MPGLDFLAVLFAAAMAQASPQPYSLTPLPDTSGVGAAVAVGVAAAEPGGRVDGGSRASAARARGFERATRLAMLVPVAPLSALASDSPAPPPPLVDYSDAYYTRLQIHKWASWAMLPLFAAQYFSGQKLVEQGRAAPGWARAVHGPAAAGVAGLFGVNTVTGVWNLWEGRKDPYGRKWRTAHGLLMLAADAGFVATGILAGDAGENGSVRNTHKQVAMVSMGVAVTSWLMMLPPFRRD